jgi:transcription elongation GreA/GreB family factor
MPHIPIVLSIGARGASSHAARRPEGVLSAPATLARQGEGGPYRHEPREETMERRHTTKAGLARLRERLAQAEAAYEKVCASNPEAAEAGDSSVWHDNFAYEENQRQMHQWACRVSELRTQLAQCALVEPGPLPEEVGVGTCVELLQEGGRRERWVIAGWDDGDAAARRVAYNSPLGRALLGARVGELREVRLGSGVRELEVVAIHAAEVA